jgi:hypothetical protein
MIGNQIWANSYKNLVNKTLNERMWQGISQKKPTIERMWQGIFQKKPALRNESDLIAFSCNAYKLQLPDWKRNFQEQFHLQFNSIKNIHSVKNWMATKDFYIHGKKNPHKQVSIRKSKISYSQSTTVKLASSNNQFSSTRPWMQETKPYISQYQ